MIDLRPYEENFNGFYPEYADGPYNKIVELFNSYIGIDPTAAESEQFNQVWNLVVPVIKAKNWKTQVPFPENIGSLLPELIRLKNSDINGAGIMDSIKEKLSVFLNTKGIQLPTASALLHFSFPDHCSIVDRKVETACSLLKSGFPEDFSGMDNPRLPAHGTLFSNKWNKYCQFMHFIQRVVTLQQELSGNEQLKNGMSNYRFVDKALMVYGDIAYRQMVENRI